MVKLGSARGLQRPWRANRLYAEDAFRCLMGNELNLLVGRQLRIAESRPASELKARLQHCVRAPLSGTKLEAALDGT